MIQYKRTTTFNELLLDFKIAKESYLRVDFDFDDDYIRQCIESATTWLEQELRIPIRKGTYNMIIDLTSICQYDYPKIDPFYDFKKIKVHSINNIKTFDIYGKDTALTVTTDYLYNAISNRLFFPTYKNIANNSIDHMIINAEFGWQFSDIPADIRQSLYVITAYLYENRGVDLVIPKEALMPVAHYKRWG